MKISKGCAFTELENIYAKEISSWKTSLQNIKGIYLITDKKNGKKYVEENHTYTYLTQLLISTIQND